MEKGIRVRIATGDEGYAASINYESSPAYHVRLIFDKSNEGGRCSLSTLFWGSRGLFVDVLVRAVVAPMGSSERRTRVVVEILGDTADDGVRCVGENARGFSIEGRGFAEQCTRREGMGSPSAPHRRRPELRTAWTRTSGVGGVRPCPRREVNQGNSEV